jgi:hypothetical protein
MGPCRRNGKFGMDQVSAHIFLPGQGESTEYDNRIKLG